MKRICLWYKNSK